MIFEDFFLKIEIAPSRTGKMKYIFPFMTAIDLPMMNQKYENSAAVDHDIMSRKIQIIIHIDR